MYNNNTSKLQELPLVSVVIPTYNRKEKLVRLIKSILKSNYPKDKIEIIVIDDASTDGTFEEISSKFQGIKLIRNKEELLVSECRNIGIKTSRGKYIFFIDDDNIVDEDCINILVNFMEKHKEIGIAGPLMYYYKDPKRIWCAGVKHNMTTSKTIIIGRGKMDNGQFEMIESDSFPNAFITRREIIEKYNIFFDSVNFPIHYEESDFCQKIKSKGWKIVLVPQAKVWHDVNSKLVTFHIYSKMRAYYAGRNRVLFHKKYSNWWQYLLFILIFNWLFLLYYLKMILFDSKRPFRKRLDIAKAYIKGCIDGFRIKQK